MKTAGILALTVLIFSGLVSATDMTLDPEYTQMAATDVEVVDVCITKSTGGPFTGVDLSINQHCRDTNGDEVCGPGDIMSPAEFTPSVTSTPTDVNGCGEVTLTTNNAPGGWYAYEVNGQFGGVDVDSEYGLVLVPEFTTIGAGLVLLGAGAYLWRRRK